MPSHHIALFQEADHHHTSHLCRFYGIGQHQNIDKKLTAHAGGTGIKIIRPLYTRDRERYLNGDVPGSEACWTDYITRPETPHDDNLDHVPDRVLTFSVVDICSFHPVTALMRERGGKAIWRCANAHYNSYWAKQSPESVQTILGRLFMLCIRDKIDILTGDFNRSAKYIKMVLNDFYARKPDFPKVYVIYNVPNSPEIVTIIFVHTTSSPDSKVLDMVVTHRGIWTILENADFGVQEGDRESHWPQLTKLSLFNRTSFTPCAARHRRSTFADRERRRHHTRVRNYHKALIATAKSKATATTPKHPYIDTMTPRPSQTFVPWNDNYRAHLIQPQARPFDKVRRGLDRQ